MDLGGQIPKIDDGPWPQFPADLISIAVVVATQCRGPVLLHEKMFESRMFFVDKLTSMGARLVVCDPHRVVVAGPATLQGGEVESPDIRAGMAILIAALCARGRSEIHNIGQIERGYERIDERLHGAVVRVADRVAAAAEGEPAEEGDALVTGTEGLLLAVTVADCVPVFAVDEESGALGLAHAGWRGAAAGVLEAMLEMLVGELDARAGLRLHLGPAICGDCYEVGPEVPRALGLEGDPTRVDLRAVLAGRAASFGVPPDRITRSRRCTRCDRDRLYSHRGGDGAARSCGFLARVPR
jgi:YfiH family protein